MNAQVEAAPHMRVLTAIVAVACVLVLTSPGGATTLEINSGFAQIGQNQEFFEGFAMMSGPSVSIRAQAIGSGDDPIHTLPTGSSSIHFTSGMVNGLSFGFSPEFGSLILNFMHPAITVLSVSPIQDPSRFGQLESAPFIMTGIFTRVDIEPINFVGQGIVTASWASPSERIGDFGAAYSFTVPEPPLLILLAISLVGVLTARQRPRVT